MNNSDDVTPAVNKRLSTGKRLSMKVKKMLASSSASATTALEREDQNENYGIPETTDIYKNHEATEESKQLGADGYVDEHGDEMAADPVFMAPAKKRSSFSMLKKAITSSIRFGATDGSEKCPMCLKNVFKVERVVCSGASWHKQCLVCGGTGDGGCKRKLLKDYLVHQSNPFCKICYTKINSAGGNNDNVNHNNPMMGYHGGDEVPMPVTASVSGGARAELPQLLKGVKVSERASNFDGHLRLVDYSHLTLGAPPVPINKCAKCDKTVYKAEEVFSSGGVWHKSCFTCGALCDVGCNRVLARDNFLQHCGVPFCKACFGKYSKDPNFKGISPEFRKWEPRGKGDHLGGFEGGDFPEEMGANLESGLMMENENALKSRKDEDSDEYSEVDSVDVDQQIQNDLDDELDGHERVHGSTKGSTKAGKRSSVRLSQHGSEGEPEDIITKMLWTDADPQKMTIAEKMGGSPFVRNGRNVLTKLTNKAPVKKLRGENTRLDLTAFSEKPYDKSGVLYYIGTGGSTAPYKNPHLTGQVTASMSSLFKGSIHTLVEQVNGAMPNYSNNTKRSWMAVDLGRGRRLIPNRYCVRHGATGRGNALRNWELRARERDTDGWTILRSHVNDDSISEQPYSAAAWMLFPPKGKDGERRWMVGDGFRHFLILQTGLNSSNNDCMFIGGIELYGTLIEEEDYDT